MSISSSKSSNKFKVKVPVTYNPKTGVLRKAQTIGLSSSIFTKELAAVIKKQMIALID